MYQWPKLGQKIKLFRSSASEREFRAGFMELMMMASLIRKLMGSRSKAITLIERAGRAFNGWHSCMCLYTDEVAEVTCS